MDVSMPTKPRKRKRAGNEETSNTEVGQEASHLQPSETVSFAPRGINVSEFIESRALEIKNMSNALKEASASKGKRAFQMMPRHMRRRAASHNIKRIPTRLREKAKAEIVNAPPKTTKRPSRKFRRRPSNLLKEYNRRQRKVKWLETHIWHAKRFRIVDRWGYKIPFEPCDKSFRATYRASNTGCLMQDQSYMSNVEICGSQSLILSGLSHFTSQTTGLTFAAKLSLNGGRQGSVYMYSKDCYPLNCIGPVKFIWKPISNFQHSKCYDNDYRCLLLTCHPVMKEQLFKELSSVFTVDPENATEIADSAVIVKFREIDLVRFSLRGELSHTVLNNALDLCDINVSTGEKWWQLYYNSEKEHQENLKAQHELWQRLSICNSPSSLPSSVILGLTVNDPRLTTPMKKRWPPNEEKREDSPDYESGNLLKSWPSNVQQSPLWDATIRNQVKNDQITTYEINQLRSKLLVPGTTLELGDAAARIPILLVHQKSLRCYSQGVAKARSDYGSGWDVIVPSGWAMPFWINLIYQGARAGGLRESINMHLESTIPHFPDHYVDTASGQQYLEDKEKELEAKYLRYPPDKCVPYSHMGISSPFVPPLKELVSCWCSIIKARTDQGKTNQETNCSTDSKLQSVESELYVVRDIATITKLGDILKKGSKIPNRCNKQENLCLEFLSKIQDRSLFCVSVLSIGSGCPEDNALISIPTKADLKMFAGDKSFCPIEAAHKGKKDKFASISKEEGLENSCGIAGDCTRWTIGYCISARYGLSHGKGIGLAYVSSIGLNELLKSQSTNGCIIVLYRNIKTLTYRFATLDVV